MASDGLIIMSKTKAETVARAFSKDTSNLPKVPSGVVAKVATNDTVNSDDTFKPGDNRNVPESNQKDPNDLGSPLTIIDGVDVTVSDLGTSNDKPIVSNILAATEDLSKYSYNKIRHFSRYHRSNIGSKIDSTIDDFTGHVIRTAKAYYKKTAVGEMKTDLAMARLEVRKAYALNCISRNIGSRWINKIDKCDSLVASWEHTLLKK